jgi:predicted O-methyltransferase YrrM
VVEAALRNSDPAGALNIVEVGSYKGRSTVAMGLTLAALSQAGTIYAVDPHEGVRSGKRDRVYKGGETYNDFLDNIKRFGLEKFVRCLRSRATETRIEAPISFILIDAMHLFKNVREDFSHFEKSIIRNGLMAFHDYQDEFPGVVEFVNSLIHAKNAPYRKIHQAHSLIVLEKVS